MMYPLLCWLLPLLLSDVSSFLLVPTSYPKSRISRRSKVFINGVFHRPPSRNNKQSSLHHHQLHKYGSSSYSGGTNDSAYRLTADPTTQRYTQQPQKQPRLYSSIKCDTITSTEADKIRINRHRILLHPLRSLTTTLVAIVTIAVGLLGPSVTDDRAMAIDIKPSPITTSTSTSTSTSTLPDETSEQIYRLTTGIQFRNLRIGSGTLLSPTRTEPIPIHLRAATLSDGALLFDTRSEPRSKPLMGNDQRVVSPSSSSGSPLLYTLGTVNTEFDVFGGDSSLRSRVTRGVEDALLSRGNLLSDNDGDNNNNNNNQKRSMEPMREGGVRRVLVPGYAAYGNTGVSRYDAYKMGLDRAVPRDADVVYEVEVLRCLDVEVEVGVVESNTENEGSADSSGAGDRVREVRSARACCTEENYPCVVPEKGQS